MTDLQKQLFELQDLKYKEFHQKLIPTVDPKKVIGIRIPVLRKFASEFSVKPEASAFLRVHPHTYYEENNLHAFIIEKIKDYDECMAETEKFLPYIDNWATCDSFLPKVFKKHPQEVLEKVKIWIKSDEPYTVRYGIGVLMSNYLDELFDLEYAEMVAEVRSDEYYVNMMIAWYFATALAKQYEAVLPFIEECRLDTWTHNKAIQKAIESRRIPDETKKMLRKLKKTNNN